MSGSPHVARTCASVMPGRTIAGAGAGSAAGAAAGAGTGAGAGAGSCARAMAGAITRIATVANRRLPFFIRSSSGYLRRHAGQEHRETIGRAENGFDGALG